MDDEELFARAVALVDDRLAALGLADEFPPEGFERDDPFDFGQQDTLLSTVQEPVISPQGGDEDDPMDGDPVPDDLDDPMDEDPVPDDLEDLTGLEKLNQELKRHRHLLATTNPPTNPPEEDDDPLDEDPVPDDLEELTDAEELDQELKRHRRIQYAKSFNKGTSKTRKRNKQKKRKQKDELANARKKWNKRLRKHVFPHIISTLTLMFGPEQKYHVHALRYQTTLLAQLQDKEDITHKPLTMADIRATNKFRFIHKPGIHLGFRDVKNPELRKVVFLVKITAWNGFPKNVRARYQDTLELVMRWTSVVQDVKNNAAQTGRRAADRRPSETTPHGTRGKRAPLTSRYGKMWGIGWHAEMSKGKSVGAYSPAPPFTEERIQEYENICNRLPELASFYRELFIALFPYGASMVETATARLGIHSFGDIIDGSSKEKPWANSLTATRDNFANFLHRDGDCIAAVFGLWWVAMSNGAQHFFSDKCDHRDVKGGAFILGAYGMAIDFEQAQGLVQIYWRGKVDFHATLQSTSPRNVNRWGTSVQVTTRGVNAMASAWNYPALTRFVTPADRIRNARSRIKT